MEVSTHSPQPGLKAHSWVLLALCLLALPRGARALDYGSNSGAIYDACQDYLESSTYTENRKAAASNGSWMSIGPSSFSNFPVKIRGRDVSPLIVGLGRLNTIAFDPHDDDILYAGPASGPLWMTRNGGESWAPISEAVGVSGIAVDPNVPGTIYMLSGDGNGYGPRGAAFHTMSAGVFKTTDYGKTWKRKELDTTGAEYVGYGLAMDPLDPQILFAPTSEGIYRTADGGQTWKHIKHGYFYDIELGPQKTGGKPLPQDPAQALKSLVVHATAVLPVDEGLVQAKIFRSGDGGDTWTEAFKSQKLSQASLYPRMELAVTQTDPLYIYAVLGSDNGLLGFYRSHDGGQSYQLVSNAPNVIGPSTWAPWGDQVSGTPAWFALALAANPENSQEVWVASYDSWRSPDGGQTWFPGTFWMNRYHQDTGRVLHMDFHDLVYRGGELFAANDAGIFRKEIVSDRWEDLSAGLEITQIYGLCGNLEDSSVFFFGAQDDGSVRLDPLTKQGQIVFYYDGSQCVVSPVDDARVYVTGVFGRTYRSNDGGTSFLSIAPPGQSGKCPYWVVPIIGDPLNPQSLYVCPYEVWATNNGGNLWAQITDGVSETNEQYCVGLDAVKSASGSTHLYVARRCSLYRGDKPASAGEDWTWTTLEIPPALSDCNGSSNPYIRGMAVNPRRPGEVWVTISGTEADEKVFKRVLQSDGSYEWEDVDSSSLPNVSANTLHFADNEVGGVYLGMDCGLFYRDDRLDDWMPFFDNLPWPNTMVQDLLVQKNPATGEKLLRAGTFSQGAWETPVYPAVRPAPGGGER